MSYKSIHTGQQIDAGVSAALNPDTTPTVGSTALITSGGVKSAINNTTNKILPVIVGTTNNSGYVIKNGDWFIANDDLYHASSDIPVGAAWSGVAESQTAINFIIQKFSNLYPVTPGTNVTLIKGGYFGFGQLVVITLKLQTTDALGTNAILVSGLPSGSQNVYINIGNGYNANAYGCRTGQDKLYTNGSIPSGTELNINAAYWVLQ